MVVAEAIPASPAAFLLATILQATEIAQTKFKTARMERSFYLFSNLDYFGDYSHVRHA
jgi:hypothetical protein